MLGCRHLGSWAGSDPRGLASIVFAVIVVEESSLPYEHLMAIAIYLTVGLSVFAHGLTPVPWLTATAAGSNAIRAMWDR